MSTGYIAGGGGPEQLQRGGGMVRRLLGSLAAGAVGNGPRRLTSADLPTPQLFPARPSITASEAVVPSSTGSELLPGRARPRFVRPTDGEPGADNPVDYELRDR